MKTDGTFDESFRAWAARPTDVDAETVVTRLVEAEMDSRPVRLKPAWATLAVALVAFVTGAVWWTRSLPPTPRGRPATVEAIQAPADSDIVVVWVDEQTPIQVFLTEASARGTR
jgi:hypothetical protein